MIGIDMKMPHSCRDCNILDAANMQCSITHAIVFTDKRLSDCPLHPLDDDKIRVGDEVEDKYIGTVGVVTYIGDNGTLKRLFANGIQTSGLISEYRKTGRHFDEVEVLLKKMRGEDDE